MDNKEFDKKIRELIGEFTETPGIGSWDAIESSLDKRNKFGVVFMRRAVYSAIAIAASFVLFLVLDKRDDGRDLLVPESIVVVERTPQQDEVADSPEKPVSIILGNRRLLSGSAGKPINNESWTGPEQTVHISGSQNGKVTSLPGKEIAEEPRREIKEEPAKNEEPTVKEISSQRRGEYNLYLSQEGDGHKRRSPSFALSTNISPSTSSHSVSLMAMSQMQSGYAPSNVVSTIQKAYVPQEVISNTKFLMPVSVGLQMQLPLSDRISAATGVVYTMLFSHYDAISRDATRETQQTLHYLGFPLNLYYSFYKNDNLRLYASGGVMVEKGLYAFYKIMENGVPDSYGQMIDGLQWSLNGGVGAEFVVNNSLGLYFDPSFAYYFDNNQPLSIRTAQQLQFKFEVGLRFHL
jgi:hypothetical protein